MRLHPKQALEYLKEVGFEMSRAKYFRQKKTVEDKKLKRLFHIAKITYEDQHLERIDRLETIEKLMWENYHAEKTPTNKVKILESIMSMPYISTYDEATMILLGHKEAKIKGESEFQKWQSLHPKPTYDAAIDGELPLKTDEEIAEFKEKWGLDNL